MPRTALLVLLAAAPLLGCSDGLKVVPVNGRVTLDGGEWPRRGMIFFVPKQPAEGYPRRPGHGDFQEDGRFSVTSFEKNDGLVPGEYLVNIECWAVPPSMSGGPPAVSAVPPAYQQGLNSGFTLTVPTDARRLDDVTFDVPSE